MAFDKDIRFELIARLCPNSTGADIRSVCTEAGMFAIRARRKSISEKDLMEAIDKVIKGYSKFSATQKYMVYNWKNFAHLQISHNDCTCMLLTPTISRKVWSKIINNRKIHLFLLLVYSSNWKMTSLYKNARNCLQNCINCKTFTNFPTYSLLRTEKDRDVYKVNDSLFYWWYHR